MVLASCHAKKSLEKGSRERGRPKVRESDPIQEAFTGLLITGAVGGDHVAMWPYVGSNLIAPNTEKLL